MLAGPGGPTKGLGLGGPTVAEALAAASLSAASLAASNLALAVSPPTLLGVVLLVAVLTTGATGAYHQ